MEYGAQIKVKSEEGAEFDTKVLFNIIFYLSSHATCTQLSVPRPMADAPPFME